MSFLPRRRKFLLFSTIKNAAADEHYATPGDLSGSGSAGPGFAAPALALARLRPAHVGRSDFGRSDLGRTHVGCTDLAQQSAAHERAGVAELCHLPLACALPVDRLVRCCGRRLRRHHVCVAKQDRHRTVIDRLLCSLRQCAVVDLCAAVAAACALAMDASGTRPFHSASAHEPRHGHRRRRQHAGRGRQLPIRADRALGGSAVARDRADACGADGLDARLHRHSLLAASQAGLCALAALSVRFRVAAAGVRAGRLYCRRQRGGAGEPQSGFCPACAAREPHNAANGQRSCLARRSSGSAFILR